MWSVRFWNTLRLPLLLSLCWCLLMLGLYMRGMRVNDNHVHDLALKQTRTLYEQIVDTRAWNAQHGGVYVRESAYGTANPWIPEAQRGIEDRNSNRFVLINPAYMSRQIAEHSVTRGTSFRITSLTPLRLANSADAWETAALQRCAQGIPEVFSLEQGNKGPVYRYMAPLWTDRPCLSCHPGAKEGDLRGGISVNLEAGPFLSSMHESQRSLAWAYALLGVAGVLGIGGATLAINRRRVLAEEASRMKSAFLANMSHDMRTPLTGILGMSDMLNQAQTPQERQEATGYLRDAAGALLEMVSDLTDHAALGEGPLRLVPRIFALQPILEQCLHLYRPLCESKGLTLNLAVEPDVPAWLYGDDFRLRQAVGNLVGNAVKFTDQGGVQVRVSTGGTASGKEHGVLLRCEVQDSGPGIAHEERERIFERFERGSAALAHRGREGTGLGLAIARGIARSMDGDLCLGKGGDTSGAHFVLSFRMERRPAPPQEVSLEVEAPRPRSDGGQHILVGEDDNITAYFVQHVLAGAGYAVGLAHDGPAILHALEQKPVNLLLLDLRLPGLDGLEVARRIREGQSSAPPDLPILVLSAALFGKEHAMLEELGITDHLLKPAKPMELLRGVARMLTKETATHASEKAVFDRKTALDTLDGQENLLLRLSQVFLEELPERLNALRNAAARQEWPAVERLSHSLKNSAATLALPTLRTVAEALEYAASRNAPPEDIATALQAVNVAADKALTPLQRVVKEGEGI